MREKDSHSSNLKKTKNKALELINIVDHLIFKIKGSERNIFCPYCSKIASTNSETCRYCGAPTSYDVLIKEKKIDDVSQCIECDRQYPEKYQYCVYDGSKLYPIEYLTPRCEKCGASYNSDLNYCPKDGGIIRKAFDHEINELESFKEISRIRKQLPKIGRVKYIIFSTFSYIFILIGIGILSNKVSNFEFILGCLLIVIALILLFSFRSSRCRSLGISEWWILFPFTDIMLWFFPEKKQE